MKVCTKLEVRSFTRAQDNGGGTQTFGQSWIRPRSLFSMSFNGLLLEWTMWMYRPNFEVRSFTRTRSWEHMGYIKTLGSPWIRRRSLFSKMFNGHLFGSTLWMWMYRPNLKSVALPVPEIIAIEVLGGGCEPQSRGRGGRRLSEMVPFERALVSSYRPSIVTFPLSLFFTCFRDIAAFVLQHATFSHPTHSLAQISTCSPGSWLPRVKVLG